MCRHAAVGFRAHNRCRRGVVLVHFRRRILFVWKSEG
jgi:hypothetical protein